MNNQLLGMLRKHRNPKLTAWGMKYRQVGALLTDIG